MNISQLLTKLKSLVYSKTETDSLLGGKVSSSHTHTKSEITDFPSIPSIEVGPQSAVDADTFSDGPVVTYYTSNGPSTALGASTNDGALFQQCYSSSWKTQIAADYRNGNLFTRGKNDGTWQPWRAVAYKDDAKIYLDQYDTITYGVNRLQYFNTSTATTSGAANVANPYNDWFYHLLMSHGNSNGYYGDIAMCFHSDTLAFRRIVNGSDQGWRYLVKNGNTVISGYEVYVG